MSILADQALQTVVDQIRDDQWDLVVRDDMTRRPAREYLKHITSFRGLRTYDIARFIGAETAPPPDLVQGLWDEIAPSAEEWRKLGVYGPAVPVPEDAPLQDRLLAC